MTAVTAPGPLLEVDGVSVRFGALIALHHVSLVIQRGDRPGGREDPRCGIASHSRRRGEPVKDALRAAGEAGP